MRNLGKNGITCASRRRNYYVTTHFECEGIFHALYLKPLCNQMRWQRAFEGGIYYCMPEKLRRIPSVRKNFFAGEQNSSGWGTKAVSNNCNAKTVSYKREWLHSVIRIELHPFATKKRAQICQKQIYFQVFTQSFLGEQTKELTDSFTYYFRQ